MYFGCSGVYDYDVIIVIGVWRNVGIMVNVFMIIYGIEDVVEVVSLIKCFLLGRKMFGWGSFSNYVLNFEKLFGMVIKIEMWYDSFGKNVLWFLDYVFIMERSMGEKWEFFYYDWFVFYIGKGVIKVIFMFNDLFNYGFGFKNLFYFLLLIDFVD